MFDPNVHELMGDEWLNNLMACYTEKELFIFRNSSDGKIIKRLKR